jgi:single-strand DNA-binding protein
MISKTLILTLCFVCGNLPAWSWTSSHSIISKRSRPSTVTVGTTFTATALASSNMDDDDDWDVVDPPPLDLGEGDGDVEAEEDRLSDEELEAFLGDWDERVARFNTLHLVGRVGNSPEPRYFDDGNCVVNLSLACTRKYHYMERQAENIQSGNEETDWFGLEIWGSTAQFVSKYVDKGARVGVIGNLQVDEWIDKETGEKRNKAKVIVREFEVLETKAEAELRRSNSRENSRENARGPSFYGGSSSNNDNDDEIYKPSKGGAGGFFD